MYLLLEEHLRSVEVVRSVGLALVNVLYNNSAVAKQLSTERMISALSRSLSVYSDDGKVVTFVCFFHVHPFPCLLSFVLRLTLLHITLLVCLYVCMSVSVDR